MRRLQIEFLERRHLMAVLTVTNTNDSGIGSLRDALNAANADGLVDTIQFALPGSGVRTIDLLSELPAVFTPMQIDGWSQSGYSGKPLIQLRAAAAIDYGLSLFANDSLVRGLIFTGFDNSHLAIWGGDNNKVQGNYFGTNAAGTALDGGNTFLDALFIGDGSVGNIIGVDGDGVADTQERNIVGGGQSGIGLWGSSSTGNRISGNYVGTNATGANLGNQFAGVWLDSGANQNFVGSNNDGLGDGQEGNIISRNGTHGIVINGASTQRNRLSRNLVYDNALMEIDLGNNFGDLNDPLDLDDGPNANTNKPELTSLSLSSTTFVIGGSLSAEVSKSYRIELFASAQRDPSGYGGAQRFLAAFILTTSASGQATFNRTVSGAVEYGWVITATATDPLGNTSEFSSSIWDGMNLAQTFALSSLPSANHTIYLDFNGHTTTGTLWNSNYLQPTIVTPAFSLDSQPAFSNAELQRIQAIYQRVVEDFRPFNVNITTQEPPLSDLIKDNTGTDTRWGVRVAIGGSWTDWLGSSAGGVAWLDSFNWDSDTPAFVFSIDNNNNSEDLTAEAISHEVGHSLGLEHDGTPASEYYFGHGSGATSWNAIMGGGSSAQVTQWSRGQYLNASNNEDDLAIITTQNGFGYRADDYGNGITTAARLTTVGPRVQQTGLISTSTDRDFFFFDTTGGLMDLRFGVAQMGANLDIYVRLYDSSGVVIGSNNPVDQLTARISRTLTAGRYYLSVDGIGKGSPLTVADGYTDYGSLGFYSITGAVNGINLSPVLGGFGSAINYTNNTGALLMAAGATVTDSDSPNLAGGILTIAVTSGIDASNRINIANGVFTRSGRDVFYSGTLIGTVNSSAGIGLTSFQVTFNSAATVSIVQQLLRAINFRTVGNTNLAPRQLTFTLSDGDGGISVAVNVAVNVLP